MSSGKAFPPRLYLTATSLYNLNNGYSGNFNPVRENFGFGCDDTIYISMKEHSALIEAKDKEIEQMLMSLFNLADHLETFLNVSQKIHFPEARDDLKIANEIILKKQKEALAGGEDV